MSTRSTKVAIAAGWLVVAAGWAWYLRAAGQSPVASIQGAVDAARGAWWAVPVFVGAYLARPLVLLPASILTVAAGILFGPVWGVPLALAAATASALVAFQIGTAFTPDSLRRTEGDGLLERWSARMRADSFLTVMVMRLAFLPYDLVNYTAGFVRIRRMPFVAATALGSLPGTVAFVLAGASLHRLDAGVGGFDPAVFAVSVAVFAVSVAIAKVLQRRAVEPGDQPTTTTSHPLTPRSTL